MTAIYVYVYACLCLCILSCIWISLFTEVGFHLHCSIHAYSLQPCTSNQRCNYVKIWVCYIITPFIISLVYVCTGKYPLELLCVPIRTKYFYTIMQILSVILYMSLLKRIFNMQYCYFI